MSLNNSGGCLWWCSYLGCSCFDCLVCALQSQRWGRIPVLLEWEHIWPLEKKVRGQHLYEVFTHSSFLREPVLILLTVNEPSPEELLRQLQEERTCKVCMDKLVSIVFIPCGHLVVCCDCATSLRHCPICRAVIRGSVRAFMSWGWPPKTIAIKHFLLLFLLHIFQDFNLQKQRWQKNTILY